MSVAKAGSLSPSLSLSLSFSFSLGVFAPLSHSVSLSCPLTLSFPRFLNPSLPHSLTLCLSRALFSCSRMHFSSRSLSRALSLPFHLSLSLCIRLYLMPTPCLSLARYFFHTHILALDPTLVRVSLTLALFLAQEANQPLRTLVFRFAVSLTHVVPSLHLPLSRSNVALNALCC